MYKIGLLSLGTRVGESLKISLLLSSSPLTVCVGGTYAIQYEVVRTKKKEAVFGDKIKNKKYFKVKKMFFSNKANRKGGPKHVSATKCGDLEKGVFFFSASGEESGATKKFARGEKYCELKIACCAVRNKIRGG